MDMQTDPKTAAPAEPGPLSADAPAELIDVPGMLAGEIGARYASEERRRRSERMELMIARALDQH